MLLLANSASIVGTYFRLVFRWIDDGTHLIEKWVQRNHLLVLSIEFFASVMVILLELFGPRIRDTHDWAHDAKALKLLLVSLLGVLLACESSLH